MIVFSWHIKWCFFLVIPIGLFCLHISRQISACIARYPQSTSLGHICMKPAFISLTYNWSITAILIMCIHRNNDISIKHWKTMKQLLHVLNDAIDPLTVWFHWRVGTVFHLHQSWLRSWERAMAWTIELFFSSHKKKTPDHYGSSNLQCYLKIVQPRRLIDWLIDWGWLATITDLLLKTFFGHTHWSFFPQLFPWLDAWVYKHFFSFFIVQCFYYKYFYHITIINIKSIQIT